MKNVGFAHSAFTTADVYERGRSGYPAEAVAHLTDELDIGKTTTVVDLAAGTGKFTRLLVPTGASVVAVEPVAAMRQQLAEMVPEASSVGAAAERLPLANASVDAVTVAQAFHWFEPRAALAEIHRVLRPGGRLGLIWNRADTSVEWVAKLSIIRTSARRDSKGSSSGTNEALRLLRKAKKRATRLVSSASTRPLDSDPPWVAKCRGAFESTLLFSPLQESLFRHGEEMDTDRLIDWIASFSSFSRLSSPEQTRVLDQARRLSAELTPRFMFPYRTDVFWCTAL